MATSTSKPDQELQNMVHRLTGLKAEFIECRDSHLWTRVQPLLIHETGRTIAHQCQRCKMIRHRHVDPATGVYLSAPSYQAPPGYHLRSDEGEKRPSAGAVRVTLLALDSATRRQYPPIADLE